MLANDFKFGPDKYFIAMEYYCLILNRTFLIIYGTSALIGIKVNGLVSADNPHEPLASRLVRPLTIKGNLLDPLSYVKKKDVLKDVELYTESSLIDARSDFVIRYDEIVEVKYDHRKKWGMGEYPHDGKVYVKTQKGKREFIILGDQSGKDIADQVLKNIKQWTNAPFLKTHHCWG